MSRVWELLSKVWDWLSGTNPDVWSAVAAWLTLVVAVVASIAALRQVREARRSREEQAQPYVVAYMEQNQASAAFMDLVVRNFGVTGACDVRIASSPALRRTTRGQESEEVQLFESIPFLAPGQEWRTFWDSGIERTQNQNIEDRYEVTVRYKDSRGRQMDPTEAILDWSVHDGRHYIEIYGVHHAAKALQEIQKNTKKWSEGTKGLAVYARDGDKKDSEMRERRKEWERRVMEQRQPTGSDQAEMTAADAPGTVPPSRDTTPETETS